MKDITLEAYKVLHEKGAFFLRKEKQWAKQYTVATSRSNITSQHLFQIAFSESGYN